jgi:hypothetical protein
MPLVAPVMSAVFVVKARAAHWRLELCHAHNRLTASRPALAFALADRRPGQEG